jgi:Glycosyl transferases group 1
MRIFISCLQSRRKHSVPGYQFWETYFKRGIEEAGHEWIEAETVDWAEGLVYYDKEPLKEWRDRTWSIALSSIKQQHEAKPIDLFLSYLFPNQVEPTAIKEIQDLGIPCVNFFCDNVREFKKVPQVFHCFDLHWVPEYKALSMYERAKLKYIHAAMPVWISPEQRTAEHPETYNVSFIGSRDAQREALLAEVLQYGVPLEIRGAGWSEKSSAPYNSPYENQSVWKKALNQWQFATNLGIKPWLRKINDKFRTVIPNHIFADYIYPSPNFQEYIAIIQQSKVSLGINRYPSYQHPFSQPDTYSRMRDIEAPMMGACYLTEWTEGLEELYELGEEIETYRNAEEMAEKLCYLNRYPEKRKMLRVKGQKKALEMHSIPTSINKIISYLNK